ncbi:MAG: arylsulfatase, partial [Mesorhizobium sp.]
MKRANVIFICADQMRYDALSVTGNRVAHTANIDRIAARGATFHRHFTPNQICSPSRATMATGLYPRHHGLWRNGVALDDRLPNLWQALSLAGYATKGVGKLHFQPLLAPVERDMPESLAYWERPGCEDWHGPYFGFDAVDLVMGEANEATRAGHYAAWLKRNHPEVVDLYEPDASPDSRAQDLNEVWKSAVPPELHYTSWIADRAIDFIERQGRQAEPFGLFVSFPDPHHP